MDQSGGEHIVCSDCGSDFLFTSTEQQFYEEKGLSWPPKRCKPCRAARKTGDVRGRAPGRDAPRGGGGNDRGGNDRGGNDRGGFRGPSSYGGGGAAGGGAGGGGRPREGGFGPPREGGFRGPPRDGGFGGPPREGGFRGPPRDGGFGGPPREGGFGGPPREGGFRAGPPRDAGFRGPPREGGFGPPRGRSDGYGAPRGAAAAPGPRDFRRDAGPAAARPRFQGPPAGDAEPRAPRTRPRFDITCQTCGTAATVPFKPLPGRDIFCPACYRARKGTVPTAAAGEAHAPQEAHESHGSHAATPEPEGEE